MYSVLFGNTERYVWMQEVGEELEDLVDWSILTVVFDLDYILK